MSNSILDEILFNGGLDTDSDDKFIKQGDYVDALNVIKVEDGEEGIVVNIKGNEAIYENNLQGVEYLCGWTYYDKNESIILFLYSPQESTRLSMIVEFNPFTLVATTIVGSDPSDILQFQNPSTSDYFIKASMNGDWLAWTDNVNPPRMINISDVKDDSPTITESYLSVIKKPPLTIPTAAYGYDSDVERSNVVTSIFKFKYRNVYSDYRQSVWSGSSSVLMHPVYASIEKDIELSGVDNYIDITIYSGGADVEWIEIAAIDEDDNDWRKIASINKGNTDNIYLPGSTPTLQSTMNDDTSYLYRFYNTSYNEVVDSDEILKPFDNVPRLAETCSFFSDDRLAIAGGIYGYDIDSTVFDIDFEPIYDAIPSKTAQSVLVSYTNSGGDGSALVSYDLSTMFPSFAKKGDIIVFSCTYRISDASGFWSMILDRVITFAYDTYTLAEMVDYLSDRIGSATWSEDAPIPSTTSIVLSGNRIVFTITWSSTVITAAVVTVDDTYAIFANDGYSSMKRGVNKKIGIVYFDDYGRKSSVIIGDKSDVAIDGFSDSDDYGLVSIDFVINHTAPSWATKYRFAYAKNVQSFGNIYVKADYYVFDSDGVIEPGLVALDITSSVLSYDTTENTITGDSFVVEVGDKIKRAYTNDLTVSRIDLAEYSIYDIRTSIYYANATEFTGLFIIIKPDDWRYDTSLRSPIIYLDYLIHVSKDFKTIVEDVFYEIGDIGICSSGTHTPSSGTITDGDVWMRWLAFDDQTSNNPYHLYFTENYYPSSKSNVLLSNADMVNLVDETYREQYINSVRWSGKYFNNTQINGLSSFDLINSDGTFPYKLIASVHGKIKGLEELGNSLVVICEEKVLSGFVGATEYTDTAGNVNIVKSTTPIGYLRPHAEQYGTFLKESIINNGKYIYFFDLFNGVVVRKSANGLFPISGRVDSPQGSYDYKMRTHFKALSENLIESLYGDGSSSVAIYDDVKCFMGYDPYHEHVYITFVDRSVSANNETLIFDEPSNRWVSKYTSMDGLYKTTFFPFNKSNIFSYKEASGILYKLNSNDVPRCYLYDEQQESYIQFTTHSTPNIIKIFNSLGIHSDSQWTVESIEADDNLNYTNGFYSKIPDANFVKDEGVLRASFMRNMKTRSSVATNFDLVNGDECRTYVVKIKLTNDETAKTELFKVDVVSQLSK